MTPEELAQQLADLGVDRHSSKALALLPAVEVAWADGSVDAAETGMILQLADERFHLGEEGARLLRDWLTYAPSQTYRDKAYAALKMLAASGASGFGPETIPQVIQLARDVAETSGGVGCLSFFRFGAVSGNETRTLNAAADRLANALADNKTAPEDEARWSKRVTVMFDPDGDTDNDELGPELVGVVIVEIGGERTKLLVGDKPMTMGSAESCRVRFGDADIDAEHAQVFTRRRRFYIKDLGSRRGTFVNGERIGERRLLGGETLGIGNQSVVFKMAKKS